MTQPEVHPPPPPLERRFGLIQATALNMSNMIGIGPFITIPLLMSALNGPRAMCGWVVALMIAIPDGLIWSELGAALPGSGGTYHYLREAFGRERWGRFMAFLFIWQFILSGPLEIASGYIGFVRYLRYVWRDMTPVQSGWVIVGLGSILVWLLFRRLATVARIAVFLWIGTLITTGAVIVTGALHFDPRLAFDFPPGSFDFSLGFLLGLGAAARIGVYDYLGYYDICYIGDEVKNPGRVIPRSIVVSVVAVAAIYLAINLSIIGVVPWRSFVPAEQHPESDFVVSMFMERIHGPRVASLFTGLVLWTTVGSLFALLLGYSRIPYAAARDGCFFRIFGKVHPTRHLPHVSLFTIGAMAIACSFVSLGAVIDALLTTRILIQFVGQIGAVMYLRRTAPNLERPYRIWAYPLPCLVALFGWLFIFVTTDRPIVVLSLGMLAAGVLAFLIWSRWVRGWPFANAPGTPP